jgi:hypothetical protein
LNACELPSLWVTGSSTVEAHDCTFKQIALSKSSGVFTNCKFKEEITRNYLPIRALLDPHFFRDEFKEEITGTTNNNVRLIGESTAHFTNCQIRWLTAYRNSQAFITDSFVDSAWIGHSSQAKIKNSTISCKTRPTTITAKSTLEAHNLTIQRSPITAQYYRATPIRIESSFARLTGNLKFDFEENISKTRSDITIIGSTMILPQTISANLLPIFFMTGGRISYPEGLQIDVPGIERNEFHKILMRSLVPADESKKMFMPRVSALPFRKLSKDLRINYQGRLFYKSPATLDDMSENEIAYAKSLIPSRAFLASKGASFSRELMNNRAFFTPLSFKIYMDTCPACRNPEIPCNTVANCGHTYHERCYRIMISQAKKDECALCKTLVQPVRICRP